MRPDRGPTGWLVIDKPPGVTSSWVVERVRRATGGKTGHAGTLDPLATGVLPIALGEATKMIAYAVNQQKRYRFRICWGVARSTDDCEGEIVAESPARPDRRQIEAILPRFIGTIAQVPPVYSAIKIDGRRSYALARAGVGTSLPARAVQVSSLRLIATPGPDDSDFEATVGKGTYIRALARDLAVALGTLGHVTALRRLAVGPFTEADAVSLESASNPQYIADCGRKLLPIETALTDIPVVALTEAEAIRLRCGQRVAWNIFRQPREAEQPVGGTVVAAWHDHMLVALAMIDDGSLKPLRVLNL